jgi:hypothetical protein
MRRLRKLARELAEFALDAASQGTSRPLSEPTWHSFISTWEDADDLFRRGDFQAVLDDETRARLVALLGEADETASRRRATREAEEGSGG